MLNLPPPLILPLVLITKHYCDLFHIRPITVQRTMSFPEAKLQTLRIVVFFQYYIKMHLHFSDPLDQTFSETFHSLEGD